MSAAANSAPRLPHHFESQVRSLVALAVALSVYFLMLGSVHTRVIAAWDSFSCVLLATIWMSILRSGIAHIRHRASSEDSSRTVIFLLTVAAAFSSIFAVVGLLSAAQNKSHIGAHAVLSGVAVLSSWILVHTMFTLRYAHLYYGEGDEAGKPIGGLEFPNDDTPAYLDFAYFSFVIGMTCQVSDVQISSKRLRSLALVHGVLSFCFNTVILALTINTVSGLL